MDCLIELHTMVGKDVEKQLRGFGVHMRHRRKDTAQKSDQLPLSTKSKEPLYSVINATKSISTMPQSNLETLRSWGPMVELGRRCFQSLITDWIKIIGSA